MILSLVFESLELLAVIMLASSWLGLQTNTTRTEYAEVQLWQRTNTFCWQGLEERAATQANDYFTELGHRVVTAEGIPDTRELLTEPGLSCGLPATPFGSDGTTELRKIAEICPGVPVVRDQHAAERRRVPWRPFMRAPLMFCCCRSPSRH